MSHKKNTAACETCTYDLSIWSEKGTFKCWKEVNERRKLGYPNAGYDCPKRCRVPGSDDDFVGKINV